MGAESKVIVLKKQIHETMNFKETEELLAIWRKGDHAEWTDAAFDVVKEILLKRLGEIPLDSKPDNSKADLGRVTENNKELTRSGEESKNSKQFETCWFCRKYPSDVIKTIDLPIHLVTDSSTSTWDPIIMGVKSRTTTTYHYMTGKINIPRCKECGATHEANEKKYQNYYMTNAILHVIVALVALGAAYLLRENGILVLGGAIAAWFVMAAILFSRENDFKKSLGLREGDLSLENLPEVTRILKSGWKVGSIPG